MDWRPGGPLWRPENARRGSPGRWPSLGGVDGVSSLALRCRVVRRGGGGQAPLAAQQPVRGRGTSSWHARSAAKARSRSKPIDTKEATWSSDGWTCWKRSSAGGGTERGGGSSSTGICRGGGRRRGAKSGSRNLGSANRLSRGTVSDKYIKPANKPHAAGTPDFEPWQTKSCAPTRYMSDLSESVIPSTRISFGWATGIMS